MIKQINSVLLKDVSVDKGAYGISASAVEHDDNLYNYLRITDISDDGVINKNGLMSVDDVKASKYLLKENDIVFARTGNSTGRSYFYDKNDGELVYAGYLIKFSLDENKINPKYMKYYTLSEDYHNWINSICTGSTRKNINAKIYGDMPIILPSRKQQDFLVSFLSKLDKKIEINKKINHNLYHILMDLFIKNYLNFNENEFSNSIETIPKLWNIGHFNDIIKEVIAGDWGKSEIEGNYTKKTFCIRGADIPDLKENFVSTIPIRYILQKNFNKKHLIENSVVIEISGGSPSQSTGRTLFITNNLLNQYNHDLICTNFCKSILAEEEYSYFVYFYLNYLYDRNVMFAYENGTTGIKNFDFKSFFNNFPIIIPVKEELVTFNKICELFFDKIYKNIDEMNKLSHIKNILLPKLMSGEIDVSNIKI